MIILLFVITISLFTGIALLAKRMCKTVYRDEDLALVRQDSSVQIVDIKNHALLGGYILCAIFAILIPLVISGSTTDIIFLLSVAAAIIIMFLQAFQRRSNYYVMSKEQVSLITKGEQLWQVSWKDISLAHRFIRVFYWYYGELVFNLFLHDGQVLQYLPQEIEPYLQEHGIEILKK